MTKQVTFIIPASAACAMSIDDAGMWADPVTLSNAGNNRIRVAATERAARQMLGDARLRADGHFDCDPPAWRRACRVAAQRIDDALRQA